MQNDVYKAPEASLEGNESNQSEVTLASRWRRLGASMLDSLFIMIPSLVVMYFMGWFEHFANGTQPPLWYAIPLFVFGVIIYLAINYSSLDENGQTVGKKLLNIKVVDLENNKPDMSTLIFKRYAPYVIIAQIPVIGAFLSLINILFIFGNEKRCVHDHIAKTKVVNS